MKIVSKSIVHADLNDYYTKNFRRELDELMTYFNENSIPYTFDATIRYTEYSKALHFNHPEVGDRVLEIGGAQSLFPIMLSRRASEVVCVDANGWGDREKHKEFLQLDELENVCGYLEDYKDTKKFDRVYSICVIEHIPHFEEALEHIAKLLKKGGLFSLTFDMAEKHWEMGELWDAGRYFNKDTYTKLILDEYFEVVGNEFICDADWTPKTCGSHRQQDQKNKQGYDVPTTFGFLLLKRK